MSTLWKIRKYILANYKMIFLLVLINNLLFGGVATQYVFECWYPEVELSYPVAALIGVGVGTVLIPTALILAVVSILI